jgi:hypothetical protein
LDFPISVCPSSGLSLHSIPYRTNNPQSSSP